MQVIQTPNAPAAIGPYSQAVRCGDLLYLSGQVGLKPGDKAPVSGDAAQQAKQALANVDAVLTAAGMSKSNIVKVTIYATDMAYFAPVNAVYAAFFTPPYPARVFVAVKALPAGALVELEAIAHA